MEKGQQRKQFSFHNSVVDSATAAIGTKSVDEADDELQEGKSMIEEGQNIIQLADRSECGWVKVSADEKRKSKAKKKARKVLYAKKEKSIRLDRLILTNSHSCLLS